VGEAPKKANKKVKKMRIAITPGVYKRQEYDVLKTLDLAAGKSGNFFRAEIVQVLVNEKLVENAALCAEIARKAKECKIELITHAHSKELDSGKAKAAHIALLKNQAHKRMVVHYGYPVGLNFRMEMAGFGIKIYVENTRKEDAKKGAGSQDDEFVGFLVKNKRFLGGALDLPRYYQDARSSDLPEITAKVVGTARILNKSRIPVIYHVTGYKSFKERRGEQVAPGDPRNVIPFWKIFRGISAFSDLDHSIAVIENEKPEHAILGAKYLRNLRLTANNK
jgi:hypothetical protein